MGLRTLLVALLWAELAMAQSSVVKTVLHNFATPPKGATPLAGVIVDTAGNLYGTTSFGGAYGNGTVFEVCPSGQVTVLHSFHSSDGATPFSGVTRDEVGNLYGTTTAGGAFNLGVVFKIDVSGNETVLHAFAGADGIDPSAGVTLDGQGNLYGTTIAGGAFNYGTAYRIDSSNNLTVLYSFSGIDGFPTSGVILDGATNLYGTTSYDESSGTGKVYKIDVFGQETVLHSFKGADGAYPHGELIRDAAGTLYGTTDAGGATGSGTVYKIDPSGRETVLHSFEGADGDSPYAGVIRDSAGNLYGTTQAGGASKCGTVFKIDLLGQESVVHSFGCEEGSNLTGGVVRDGSGNLYGTTADDLEAPVGKSKYGTVFQIDPSGQETVLHNFMGGEGYYPNAGVIRDRAENLFGTTGDGGPYGRGTVYRIDVSGQDTLLHSFTGFDGAYPMDGYFYPVEGVALDLAGNLYGATVAGGAVGLGTVFKIDPLGQFTVLHNFQGFDGASSYGGVVRDNAGNLYGTTSAGGASGTGTVFKIEPSGQYTVLYNFSTLPDGQTPYAGVTLDSKGDLYGTTYYGGAFGFGTVFKIQSSGQETVLYSFKGDPNQSNPLTGVIRDNAGNLYGTTSNEGPSSGGTVYKIDPSGQETALHSLTGGTNYVYYPNAGVVRDSAGNLYGTTTYGGVSNGGTVYKLDPMGKFTVLYSFQGGVDGFSPVAVTLDESGNLFGTTFGGGTKGGGTVFKLRLNPYSVP